MAGPAWENHVFAGPRITVRRLISHIQRELLRAVFQGGGPVRGDVPPDIRLILLNSR